MDRWCKQQEISLGRGQRGHHKNICEADLDLLYSWDGCYVPIPLEGYIEEPYYLLLNKIIVCALANVFKVFPLKQIKCKKIIVFTKK